MNREINRIRKLEDEIRQKDELISSIQAEKIKVIGEKNALEKRIKELENENIILKNRIREIEVQRPKISPSLLTSSFGAAVDEMQKELLKTGYAVKDFEVELKANVIYTDDGIKIHLPTMDEQITPDSLSKIKFGIKTMPTAKELEYEEIPDLRGLSRELAEDIIIEKGFKVGEITYEEWDEANIVLNQFPSQLSLAKSGSPIDLTISKERKIAMPNLIGLSLDEAKKVIEKSELKLGKVEKIPSESPENTVIGQNPPPDLKIEKRTSVDLRVSEELKKPEVSEEEFNKEDTKKEPREIKIKEKTRITRIKRVPGKSGKAGRRKVKKI